MKDRDKSEDRVGGSVSCGIRFQRCSQRNFVDQVAVCDLIVGGDRFSWSCCRVAQIDFYPDWLRGGELGIQVVLLLVSGRSRSWVCTQRQTDRGIKSRRADWFLLARIFARKGSHQQGTSIHDAATRSVQLKLSIV